MQNVVERRGWGHEAKAVRFCSTKLLFKLLQLLTRYYFAACILNVR